VDEGSSLDGARAVVAAGHASKVGRLSASHRKRPDTPTPGRFRGMPRSGWRERTRADRARLTFGGCLGPPLPSVQAPASASARARRRCNRRRLHLFNLRQSPQAVPPRRSRTRGSGKPSHGRAGAAARGRSTSWQASQRGTRFRSRVARGFVRLVPERNGEQHGAFSSAGCGLRLSAATR
jgi:hypothetical protein